MKRTARLRPPRAVRGARRARRPRSCAASRTSGRWSSARPTSNISRRATTSPRRCVPFTRARSSSAPRARCRGFFDRLAESCKGDASDGGGIILQHEKKTYGRLRRAVAHTTTSTRSTPAFTTTSGRRRTGAPSADTLSRLGPVGADARSGRRRTSPMRARQGRRAATGASKPTLRPATDISSGSTATRSCYPDPASRFQPEGPHGRRRSSIRAAYEWSDAAWHGVPPRGSGDSRTARRHLHPRRDMGGGRARTALNCARLASPSSS